MQSLPVKKLLLTGSILVLALVAFITGGIIMSSAQAASPNAQNKSTSSSKCDKKDLKCNDDPRPDPTNLTKAIVFVHSVAGNTIHATYLEPSDKKTSVIVTTTASTAYQPDSSVVAVGKTIFVGGTINKNGSITAQVVGFYDPTAVTIGGVATKINGSTIIIQAKDRTRTIHVTDSTTFLKGQPKTKETQPASRKDLKTGDAIEAQGKLNGDGSLTAKTVIIVAG